MIKGFALHKLFVILLLAVCAPVAAQTWPSRPIRIIVPFPSGGATDATARLFAQLISPQLGQPIVVENKPGATGSIGALEVARAAPDGYTLLFYGGTLWLLPLMRDKVTWDAIRDFAPITLAVSSPLLLVTNPSLAVQSAKDLIALAKKGEMAAFDEADAQLEGNLGV